MRSEDGLGFAGVTLTFTRENVNQFFTANWMLQDAVDFTQNGYWTQRISWFHYFQGGYAGQNNIHFYYCGGGKAGNSGQPKVTNYSKTATSQDISVGAAVGTNDTYALRGENYKGLIIITDSSYDGQPIVDETKLTQFFTNCNGQLTEGW